MLVVDHVRSGSTVVTSPGLFPLLQGLKGMAEVISVEALMALDPVDYQKSLKNLGKSMKTFKGSINTFIVCSCAEEHQCNLECLFYPIVWFSICTEIVLSIYLQCVGPNFDLILLGNHIFKILVFKLLDINS